MCFAPQRRALFRHLNLQKWSEPLVYLTFWLRNVVRVTTACTFSTSQLPKVVRTWCVLCILTWKCASRHNGVHFLDIATSKSGPNMVCFVLFDFEICFAPQRRALFRHLNFQKVVRAWCVLYILTWKCASRHNDVQLFISHVASWLRTRRFSEPALRPSAASNHWKNTVFRDFPTFSRACILFLLALSLLWSSLCCSSLLFFDSYHLCFSSAHVVGSLTSKLPSNAHILTCSKVQNICIYTFATHVTGKHSLVKLNELHTRQAGKGFSAATAQGKQHKVDAGVLSFGPHAHSVPVDLDA